MNSPTETVKRVKFTRMLQRTTDLRLSFPFLRLLSTGARSRKAFFAAPSCSIVHCSDKISLLLSRSLWKVVCIQAENFFSNDCTPLKFEKDASPFVFAVHGTSIFNPSSQSANLLSFFRYPQKQKVSVSSVRIFYLRFVSICSIVLKSKS